jgi:hypothetical protein
LGLRSVDNFILAKNGMDRGWMRAFGVTKWQHAGSTSRQDALAEEQIWQIITYMRAGFPAMDAMRRE